jgi:hypothetical protein
MQARLNAHEGAWLLWPLLTYMASLRQTVTYGSAAKLIGSHHRPMRLYLECIQSYCLISKPRLPALTSLVVNQDTGLPGDGFIAAADVPGEQNRVFEFDWLSYPNPTAEQLRIAREELPSCGRPEALEQLD